MFKLRPTSYLMIAATIAIVVSLLVAPAFSVSTSQCSSCHGTTYNQQLDILEGNSQNQIPTTIQVGQTQTVTVAIQNINNAAKYNQFSSVSLTLSSQNGHFSVSTPTFTIGTLSTGTATASWQITGVSQGADVLLISASATNTHNNLKYSDSYSTSPSITITAVPTPTPAPTPSPTPVPTPSPTITPTPIPTPVPTPTPTSSPTPTTPPTSNPTPDPTSTPQPKPDTETPPNATPTPNPSNPEHSSPEKPWVWLHHRFYVFNHLHPIFRWFLFYRWVDQ